MKLYPLISEYVTAILDSTDNLDKLSNLTPVLDCNDNPIMSAGNFSVVFKMVDKNTGKIYALKCFTKEQEGRDSGYKEISEEMEYVSTKYLTSVKYLENELFVFSNKTDSHEYPVVLMDWVEGETLTQCLERDLSPEHIYDLTFHFCELAMWLVAQPFSHGDIKPDNIIVRDDNSLVLVDYDGMYVPSMKGGKARELGTPDFRHPSRANSIYDEHIDDFSIVIIILSLLVIYENPSLYNKNRNQEGFLFSENDFYDIQSNDLYAKIKKNCTNPYLKTTLQLFESCLEKGYLDKDEIYRIRIPEFPDLNIIQGEPASIIISELLWKLSRESYMINLNLTDYIVGFSGRGIEVNVIAKDKRLFLGATRNEKNYLYSCSYRALTNLLMNVGIWDKSVESKMNIIYNEVQLSHPEFMFHIITAYIKRNFPNLVDNITLSISGYTITMVFKDSLDSIAEQHLVHNMLSDDTFKKNSKRFGLKKILLVDGLSGRQETILVNNFI